MRKLWVLVHADKRPIPGLHSHFEPIDLIIDHGWIVPIVSDTCALFEPVHPMAEDGRLPEKLDETSQAERVIIVRLEQPLVDLLCKLLELILSQHGMVHIMIAIEFHHVSERDQLLVQLVRLLQVLAARVLVLVEQVPKQARVLLQYLLDRGLVF